MIGDYMTENLTYIFRKLEFEKERDQLSMYTANIPNLGSWGKKKKSFTSNSRRLIITLDTGSRNSFPPNFKPMSKSMEVNNATYG